MPGYIYKRLAALLILLSLIIVGVGLTGQAIADVIAQASQVKTLDRNLEPVIVKGSQVAALIDTRIGQLFVYTYTGTAWGGQIPVQVDKVTASGSYADTEDGLLDANDEIVFMVMDLGDQASDTAWLTTLPISATWYEIEITDPLSANNKGWAYLVRSSVLTPTFTEDYVGIITTSERITITTDQYELGIPTAYQAIDYLALNGSGTDIADRTKLRVVFNDLFPSTESELDYPQTVLVKNGRVRAILQQVVAADSGPPLYDARLSTTNLAYASLLQSTASISFVLPSLVDITGVRTSIDFTEEISGAAFYNANSTEMVTVTIDGITDTMAATPVSTWTQVSTITGRLIQVSDPSPAGGTVLENYYCDNNTLGFSECDDSQVTGDGDSYGDFGILTTGSLNPAFILTSSLFILPPPAGEQDNVGDAYADYYSNHLIVAAYLQGAQSTSYLPIILKNSP